MNDAQRRCRLAYASADNDCGVRALAVCCNVTYQSAREALEVTGRKPGWGVSTEQLAQAAVLLGFVIAPVRRANGKRVYIKGRTLRALKRDLAELYKGSLPYSYTQGLLILTADHAVGAWDGELIDHAHDSLKRVVEVFGVYELQARIVPKKGKT